MKTIAVILAGGTGKRLGSDIPKQFLKVNNKMIIEYTIEIFENHSGIDEIAIVCHANYTQIIMDSIKERGYNKIKKILNGGNSRFFSSFSAIRAYDDGNEKKMLFHDGVRPLLPEDVISQCINKLDDYNAVGTGIETTDTIWSVRNKEIEKIPDRRTMYRAQTPQGFKYRTVKKAYELALADETLPVTDDCGVVMHYLADEKIVTILGDDTNIKITRKEDLLLFKNIINKRNGENHLS